MRKRNWLKINELTNEQKKDIIKRFNEGSEVVGDECIIYHDCIINNLPYIDLKQYNVSVRYSRVDKLIYQIIKKRKCELYIKKMCNNSLCCNINHMHECKNTFTQRSGMNKSNMAAYYYNTGEVYHDQKQNILLKIPKGFDFKKLQEIERKTERAKKGEITASAEKEDIGNLYVKALEEEMKAKAKGEWYTGNNDGPVRFFMG